MLFAPIFTKWSDLQPLKWISTRIFIITLFSYLMGAYTIFVISLPVYILACIYFTIIIITNADEFYLNIIGQANKHVLTENKEKIKLISWILWLMHVVPLVIFMIWFNKLKTGSTQGFITNDPYLYLKRNALLFSMIGIVLALLLVMITKKNIYGIKDNEPWYLFSMPMLVFAISMILFN